jgi:uncharacterized iron-regulated membrane protein
VCAEPVNGKLRVNLNKKKREKIFKLHKKVGMMMMIYGIFIITAGLAIVAIDAIETCTAAAAVHKL